MKVIILGGDGFCGWPTALHLSKLGHDIMIVDNLSRRNIDNELGTNSLTPIKSINKRIQKWNELTGKGIGFVNINIADHYHRLSELLISFKPDAIVHFAEQRAAPYSMKSSFHRRYTVNNNLNATHNILSAIVDSKLDIHLLHLGTMGVYGYWGAEGIIPEGYLKITTPESNSEREILYPADPGSVYHMTKTQDALFFYFYNKNFNVRITDLHQGIVWGTNTEQTSMHEDLINRFDYDGDYGTVLNRFLVQAAINYPLTVYGTGGQTRAFIHIKDSVKCIELAMKNPPESGERVQIFNQMTETHRLIDLANKVVELTGAKIGFQKNPRKEAVENDLNVSNKCFIDRGLKPITLSDGLLLEITEVAKKYRNRLDKTMIPPMSNWDSSPFH
jgi:UDP-sulfoquinovose synthase